MDKLAEYIVNLEEIEIQKAEAVAAYNTQIKELKLLIHREANNQMELNLKGGTDGE